MALQDMIKSVGTKLADAGRKYISSKALIGGAVGLAALAYGGRGRAETYNIDPSWVAGGSPAQVNALLDEDPGTLAGPYGSVVLQPGDVVNVAAGTYQLGLGQGKFEFKIGGEPGNLINLTGVDWDSTIFRGATPTSGVVWKTYVSNIELSNFGTENSFAGILISGPDYDNVNLTSIKTIGHSKHFAWDQQESLNRVITAPSVNANGSFTYETWIKAEQL